MKLFEVKINLPSLLQPGTLLPFLVAHKGIVILTAVK